jgi:hypothetical protein
MQQIHFSWRWQLQHKTARKNTNIFDTYLESDVKGIRDHESIITNRPSPDAS